MDIKQAFNWMTEKPQNNFTLGEAWQRHVLNRQPGEVRPSSMLGFTRIGRITERVILLSTVAQSAVICGITALALTPVLITGGIAAVPPVALMGTAVAAACAFNIAAHKVVGVVAGKVVDFIGKGLNCIVQSPKLRAPSA